MEKIYPLDAEIEIAHCVNTAYTLAEAGAFAWLRPEPESALDLNVLAEIFEKALPQPRLIIDDDKGETWSLFRNVIAEWPTLEDFHMDDEVTPGPTVICVNDDLAAKSMVYRGTEFKLVVYTSSNLFEICLAISCLNNSRVSVDGHLGDFRDLAYIGTNVPSGEDILGEMVRYGEIDPGGLLLYSTDDRLGDDSRGEYEVITKAGRSHVPPALMAAKHLIGDQSQE